MRPPSLKLLAALVPAVLALSATPASAGLNTWSTLGDLDADSGASWVREYATGIVPTTIYAATEGNGVYRTDNNGLDWEPMISGLDAPGAKDVRTVFTSGTTAYAGTGAGLFKSVGGGWTPVAQGAEEDPKNPKKLNAAVQAVLTGAGSTMIAGVASGGVYKSTDGGATWKPPAPGNGMVRSETVWSLAEFVPGVVFAATQSGMYRSTDFGSTWTLSSDGITGTVLRAFKDEKAPNIYYAAGTDGIFRTINAGITWSKINGASGQRPERHDPRHEAALGRRPDAPVRRHPERRLRRHHRPRPAARRGQVAQGHQQRPRRQHDRVGAVELPHHARHAAVRHAVQRRLHADLHARDQHRHRRRSATPRRRSARS